MLLRRLLTIIRLLGPVLLKWVPLAIVGKVCILTDTRVLLFRFLKRISDGPGSLRARGFLDLAEDFRALGSYLLPQR